MEIKETQRKTSWKVITLSIFFIRNLRMWLRPFSCRFSVNASGGAGPMPGAQPLGVEGQVQSGWAPCSIKSLSSAKACMCSEGPIAQSRHSSTEQL